MKKKLLALFYSTIVLLACLFGYYTFTRMGQHTPDDLKGLSDKSPLYFLQNGPYGKHVTFTVNEGHCRYTMEADKLYLKKTKFGAFNNALFKKIVAENFTLTVYINNDLRLKATKDKAEFSMGMKTIAIKDPVVVFPENMKPLARLNIDKDKGEIVLSGLSGKNEVWNLKTL